MKRTFTILIAAAIALVTAPVQAENPTITETIPLPTTGSARTVFRYDDVSVDLLSDSLYLSARSSQLLPFFFCIERSSVVLLDPSADEFPGWDKSITVGEFTHFWSPPSCGSDRGPGHVGFNPVKGRAYAAGTVIDSVAWTALDTWSPPWGAVDTHVNVYRDRTYAVAGGSVTVIDGETDAVEAHERVAVLRSSPTSSAHNPVSDTLYFSGHDAQGEWSPLHVVKYLPDNQPAFKLGEIPGPTLAVAVDPVSNHVYVARPQQLEVLDGTTHESINSFPVGDIRKLAVDPFDGRLYAAQDELLVVIDGQTGRITAEIPTGQGIAGIAVNLLTETVYVVGTSQITVIDDSDPRRPPQQILERHVINLMVEAGGASGQLPEALGYVMKGSYHNAATSLLAFRDGIERETLFPEAGEKLALAAEKILAMILGS